MADFTAYGRMYWGDLANQYKTGTWQGTPTPAYSEKTPYEMYNRFPTWQRYTGDWDDFERKYYDSVAGRIGEARAKALSEFEDKQRRVGVGDSPVTDILWANRMEPAWGQRYVDAASASTKARADLEMKDLALFNTSEQAKAQYENQLMEGWIANRQQADYAQWAANTEAGFKNRQLSLASRQNKSTWEDILGPVGAIVGQIIGSYYGGQAGGQIGKKAGGKVGSNVGAAADGNQSWESTMFSSATPDFGGDSFGSGMGFEAQSAGNYLDTTMMSDSSWGMGSGWSYF